MLIDEGDQTPPRLGPGRRLDEKVGDESIAGREHADTSEAVAIQHASNSAVRMFPSPNARSASPHARDAAGDEASPASSASP
jgi:hypothetical protein